MSDEFTQPLTAATDAPSAASLADADRLSVASDTTAGSAADSGTRAVLRDAIQKVMDEIQHHEREAKRHLQQAQDLRKELRESVAFLQAGGQPARPGESSKTAEPGPKAKSRDNEDKPHRPGGKKGLAGKRK